MTGNNYGNEVFSGRYDAFRGICLLGDGTGNFRQVENLSSGFEVDGDAKALAKIITESGTLIIATQNLDSLRMFRPMAVGDDARIFSPLAADSRAELIFSDGRREKIEFYYGSGYLSQSTRTIQVPRDVKQLIVHDFSGRSRMIDFAGIARK
jgi:enediyne biosynthesis protein E4